MNFSKCWGHMLTPLVVARVLRGLRLAPLLRRRPCRHRRGSTPCSSLLLLLLLTPAVPLAWLRQFHWPPAERAAVQQACAGSWSRPLSLAMALAQEAVSASPCQHSNAVMPSEGCIHLKVDWTGIQMVINYVQGCSACRTAIDACRVVSLTALHSCLMQGLLLCCIKSQTHSRLSGQPCSVPILFWATYYVKRVAAHLLTLNHLPQNVVLVVDLQAAVAAHEVSHDWLRHAEQPGAGTEMMLCVAQVAGPAWGAAAVCPSARSRSPSIKAIWMSSLCRWLRAASCGHSLMLHRHTGRHLCAANSCQPVVFTLQVAPSEHH